MVLYTDHFGIYSGSIPEKRFSETINHYKGRIKNMKDIAKIYQDIGIIREQYNDIIERILSKRELKKI